MNPTPAGERILLGHWVSNGDCLFATAVARQIKTDFPGCHLTWAVSSRCGQVLRGNPFVDAVEEIAVPAGGELTDHWARVEAAWTLFERETRARQARGELHRVFLTQSGFRNLHLYDGTVRGLVLAGYGRPVTVPLAPVLRLDAAEAAAVRDFVAEHPAMTRCRHVALFECSPKSGQSSVNPEFALALGRRLLAEFDDLCLVLSSNLRIESPDPRLVDASRLSFRQNAELTRHCTLLIGCSSGLTWLGTSEAARPLPTVQMISSRTHFPNSLAVDRERHGQSTDGIIELVDTDLARAGDCLGAVFREGFAAARARFHQRISLTESYAYVGRTLLDQGKYRHALAYFRRVLRVEGPRPGLCLRFARVVAGHLRRRWTAAGSPAR